ncbi:MAG: hypothetical protein Q4P06_08510 [Actinomycetaceae bacterium]|nr:hypothetical protein [Actinomycetaceae bacterium]
MALFEFDEGHLIPAQFGRSVPDGLTGDILASVRRHVLEIIARPLFPIDWNDDPSCPRLTALDASGQVVSLEVLEELNPASMIDSLSRLADTAALGWNDLAAAYPGGIDSFRLDWSQFRAAMPPSPAPGPRLILVVGAISEQVRPALDVLTSSGVEVHEISVRVLSNGRVFLDVQAVGPRVYGHNPNLLLGQGGHGMRELPAMPNLQSEVSAREPEPEREPEPVREPAPHFVPQFVEEATSGPVPEVSAQFAAGQAQSIDQEQSHSAAQDPAHEPVVEPAQEPVEEPAQDAAQEPVEEPREVVPLYKQDSEGLRVIAMVLGKDTPVYWPNKGLTIKATLTAEGQITAGQWSTGDPSEAAAIISGSSGTDGWRAWRFGDANGPSLAEALDEINAEVEAEYASAGAPQRGRRGR